MMRKGVKIGIVAFGAIIALLMVVAAYATSALRDDRSVLSSDEEQQQKQPCCRLFLNSKSRYRLVGIGTKVIDPYRLNESNSPK
jgi:hypothetical protein